MCPTSVTTARRTSKRSKSLLAGLAAGAFAFWLFIAVTGGFTTYVLGIRVSSDRILPAMTIGWIAWLMLGSDAVRTRLVRAGTLLQRNSRVVGIGIAAVTLIYSDIFHFSNVGPNIERYPTWAVQIYSPFLFLALIAPFLKHVRAFRAPPLELVAVFYGVYFYRVP